MQLRGGQNSHVNCACANYSIYPLEFDEQLRRAIQFRMNFEGTDGHGIPAVQHQADKLLWVWYLYQAELALCLGPPMECPRPWQTEAPTVEGKKKR